MFHVIFKTWKVSACPENLLGSCTWQVKAPKTACEWRDLTMAPTLQRVQPIIGSIRLPWNSWFSSWELVTQRNLHSTMMPPGHIYIAHVVTITTKSADQTLIIQIGSYTQSISKKNCQEQRMMARPHRPNQIFSDCMAPGNFFVPGAWATPHARNTFRNCQSWLHQPSSKTSIKQLERKAKKYTQKIDDQTNENKQKTLNKHDLQLQNQKLHTKILHVMDLGACCSTGLTFHTSVWMAKRYSVYGSGTTNLANSLDNLGLSQLQPMVFPLEVSSKSQQPVIM